MAENLATAKKRRARADVSPPPKRSKRASSGKQITYRESSENETTAIKSSKSLKKITTKAEEENLLITETDGGRNTQQKVDSQSTQGTEDGSSKRVVKKRKTKEEKRAEAMPIAARTVGSKILVGAHVSAAGGVQNSIANCVYIGGNAFALFLKSQRKWTFVPMQPDHRTQFLSNCKDHKFSGADHTVPPIVPHGSYLVNLAHTDKFRASQAYETFIDDLDRCHQLGIRLYNFHPGNAVGAEDRKDALKQLINQLNKAHSDIKSGMVITLLETMASVGGNTIGSKFEELAEIIGMIDDKDRIGVCLDTCHVFAAGYDLRTPEAFTSTIQQFDKIVGLKYLKALHINDSKAPLGSGRDVHANIGTGFLGLRSFWNLVNDQRLWGIPMVLETPIDRKDACGKTVEDKTVWATEIKLLESLVGMDPDGDEFQKLDRELQASGKAERDKVQDQVKRKAEKATKSKKGKKQVMTSDEGSGSE